MEERNLFTLKEVLAMKKYPFKYSQMRIFLMHRKTNGLSKVIRKVGKTIYIKLDLFDEWIESHKEAEDEH